MRTTVELPTLLFRRAKARAATRGETLRALVTRAIETEVGASSSEASSTSGRVKLPLIGTRGGPKVKLTNADLERILIEDEMRH